RKSPSDWAGTSTEEATRCQNQAFASLAKRNGAVIDWPPADFPAGLDLHNHLVASKDDSVGGEPPVPQPARPPTSDLTANGPVGNAARDADLPAQALHPHHTGGRFAQTQVGLGHRTGVAHRYGGEQFGSIKLSGVSFAVEASEREVRESDIAIGDVEL